MRDKIMRFWKDDNAAVAMEAVIVTPILAWLFVGSFTFFDAFRTYNTSVKATYAIADVLSRQTELIYASDINGLSRVFDHIVRNPDGSSMRVSQIERTASGHIVNWSQPTGGETRLRNQDMEDLAEQIPAMAEGERVIIVESFIPYIPYFNIGLSDFEFTNFTVTRPRFAGRVPWDDGDDPTCTNCDDYVDDDLLDTTG